MARPAGQAGENDPHPLVYDRRLGRKGRPRGRLLEIGHHVLEDVAPLVWRGHRIALVGGPRRLRSGAWGWSALGRLLGRAGGLLGLLLGSLADRGGGAKYAVGELALGVQELGGEVETESTTSAGVGSWSVRGTAA
jgi:hypothetical protein